MTEVTYDSHSVDAMAREIRDSAVNAAPPWADDAMKWTVLSLIAEGHRRAASLIEAEAAKLSPALPKGEIRHG